MDYLLDTSIVRPLFENHERVIRRFAQSILGDRLYTSVITEGELLFGAARLTGARREVLAKQVSEFIASLFGVVVVTRGVAATYARIRGEMEATGQLIPANDLWIASVAVERDYILVAHDRHFGQVKGLRVEDWLEP